MGFNEAIFASSEVNYKDNRIKTVVLGGHFWVIFAS